MRNGFLRFVRLSLGVVFLVCFALLCGCARSAPGPASAKDCRPPSVAASLPYSYHPTSQELFDRGFIPSPFSPDSGYIDIRGFPVGSALRDPYSGKVFILERPVGK